MDKLQLCNSEHAKEMVRLYKAAGADGLFGDSRRPLGPGDALLVIDMQNDFIPETNTKLGGRFGVPEGDLIVPLCCQLIDKTMETGGYVVATRDYHPIDHCSFAPSGPFPPHCVQGTVGSKLHKEIRASMANAIRSTMDGSHRPNGRATIAYKGFHEDTDSFGGIPYKKGGEGRIISRPSGLTDDPFTGCQKAPWTGCLLLKCSGLVFDGDIDPDAPPDLLAIQHGEKKNAVHDLVQKLKDCQTKRLLVCGLAMDFCVLDTCLNAKEYGFEEVLMVVDAARPAYIAGIGQSGSGFLSSPQEVVDKLKNGGVGLISTQALTGEAPSSHPSRPASATPAARAVFPHVLGPFGVERADSLKISMDLATLRDFELQLQGPMRQLEGKISNRGCCTPFNEITLPQEVREQAKIPSAAKTFAFAYPLPGITAVAENERTTFLSAGADPNMRFILYGGFVYFDERMRVLAANALGGGQDLCFSGPQKWRKEYTNELVSENRFKPITLKNLRDAGARHFTWIHAGETLLAVGQEAWVPAKHGAFVYLFSEDRSANSADIFFAVAE
jgi:nicotinamidase-related amidase